MKIGFQVRYMFGHAWQQHLARFTGERSRSDRQQVAMVRTCFSSEILLITKQRQKSSHLKSTSTCSKSKLEGSRLEIIIANFTPKRAYCSTSPLQ
jgi:hypothetical protein